jgi:3-hydroxyacyl-CoA dehydrogenase
MHERSGNELYRPPAVLVDLVEAGHLGRKSGRGFFAYDESGAILDEPATEAAR